MFRIRIRPGVRWPKFLRILRRKLSTAGLRNDLNKTKESLLKKELKMSPLFKGLQLLG